MRTHPLPTLFLAFLVACEPGGGTKIPEPVEPTDTGTLTATTTGTTTSGTTTSGTTTGTTTGTTGLVYDCATMPLDPQGFREVTGARAYHGIAFDPADDTLVGHDTNNNLMKVAYDGSWEILLPSAGQLEQIAYLADGDLAVSESWGGDIMRVTYNGGSSRIATDNGVYGLVVGPDDMIYTANFDEVTRIDPNTGQKTTIVPNNGFSPKVVAFDTAGTTLYFGTVGNGGRVYTVALDPITYDPLGPPVLLAQTPGDWHDGIALDICGNAYVAEFWTDGLYRINPDGTTVQTLHDQNQGNYGHGVVFGPSGGNWNDHALYQPQPYSGNTVAEIDIGVPGAHWPGTAIGTSPL